MEGTRSGRGRGRGVRQPTTDEGIRDTSTEPNPEPRVDPNAQIAAVMQQMTDLLAHVVQQQGQPPIQQPGNPGHVVESEDRALERFQKFSPPKFLGAARSWWNVIRMKWDREQTPRTWVNFVRDFNAKYFPPLVQEKKEDEFIRLRQGTQSVAEYESQFTRLAKFAPELILTEQRRVRRFIQGLNVEIQKDLAVAQINIFSDAVEKALRVENARLQVRNFQVKKRGFSASSSTQGDKGTPPKFGRGAGGGRQPGMTRGTPPRGGHNGRGPQKSTSQGSSASVARGPCGFCGKPNHTEDNCWRKERRCLRCGSAEHQIANCPVLPRETRATTQSSKANSGQSKVEGTKPKVPARVYSLEQQQVPDPSGVVEGWKS
nr:uncharacterized protein LOC113689204 [Coffea arabica]